MKERIRILLKLLLTMEADAAAVTESAVMDALVTAFAGRITRDDARRVVSMAEEMRLISGTEDALIGRVWMLTATGKTMAQQLA